MPSQCTVRASSPESEKQDLARAKARERMAENRRLLKERSPEEQEDARARAQAAQLRYRMAHRPELRAAQASRRMKVYIAEHGQHAYDERLAKKLAKREAEKEARRRARRKAQGSSRRTMQAREKVLKRAKGTVA